MKLIDLFIGIKAEQTLRDTARNAQEASPEDGEVPELCPVGKKDWIAGMRLGPYRPFGTLEEARQLAIKQLIGLGSHQRIRQENLRLYAVRPPVPVFKEPLETSSEAAPHAPWPELEGETVKCPVCGAEVHRFNLQYGVGDAVVGCYLCRGESQST